ncbi:atp-dependent RNA helicase ddx5-related [Anaeramoeba ignava]|uniref:RNA helicase n=1 Tax=Anaeramoeba ignava TaxID=1746090 RepID=A0A9Q0LTL9_ANAIG|nr:atp-dependent RNA helicase ddx5-related [Anaeramoeba ignava]
MEQFLSNENQNQSEDNLDDQDEYEESDDNSWDDQEENESDDNSWDDQEQYESDDNSWDDQEQYEEQNIRRNDNQQKKQYNSRNDNQKRQQDNWRKDNQQQREYNSRNDNQQKRQYNSRNDNQQKRQQDNWRKDNQQQREYNSRNDSQQRKQYNSRNDNQQKRQQDNWRKDNQQQREYNSRNDSQQREYNSRNDNQQKRQYNSRNDNQQREYNSRNDNQQRKQDLRPSLPDSTIETTYQDQKIKISGSSYQIHKISSFDKKLPFTSTINEILVSKKWDSPSAIQGFSWKSILYPVDFICVSENGNGKNLAFVLPAIMHILNYQQQQFQNEEPFRKEGDGPIVIVVSPTKELARQTFQVFEEFTTKTTIRCINVDEGKYETEQELDLKEGVDVVIATPRRLVDFLKRGVINSKRCSFIVLDETDLFFEMGFQDEINQIFGTLPEKRQNIMFSSTWFLETQKIVDIFFNQPIKCIIGRSDLTPNFDGKQIIDICGEKQKFRRFYALIQKLYQTQKFLVFTNTKQNADALTKSLNKNRISSVFIYSDQKQDEKKSILDKFSSGGFSLMIATDGGLRGLDIPNFLILINYDFPHNIEDYIHRIGRVAQSGKKGIAYSFFCEENYPLAKALLEIMKETKQNIPDELTRLSERDYGNRFGNSDKFLYSSGYERGRRNFNKDDNDNDSGFRRRRNFNRDDNDNDSGFRGRRNFNRDDNDNDSGFRRRRNFNKDDDGW